MKSEFNNEKRNYESSKIIGLDLVDMMPDYTKTFEENWEEYRKRYYKVFGEYPSEPKKE